MDLVTVAQALHWFDKKTFKIECQRILKQKTNVDLVWNSRDLTSPIIKANAEICQKTCSNFNEKYVDYYFRIDYNEAVNGYIHFINCKEGCLDWQQLNKLQS